MVHGRTIRIQRREKVGQPLQNITITAVIHCPDLASGAATGGATIQAGRHPKAGVTAIGLGEAKVARAEGRLIRSMHDTARVQLQHRGPGSLRPVISGLVKKASNKSDTDMGAGRLS